jgi:hypothetical protein
MRAMHYWYELLVPYGRHHAVHRGGVIYEGESLEGLLLRLHVGAQVTGIG